MFSFFNSRFSSANELTLRWTEEMSFLAAGCCLNGPDLLTFNPVGLQNPHDGKASKAKVAVPLVYHGAHRLDGFWLVLSGPVCKDRSILEAPPTAGGRAATAVTLESRGFHRSKREDQRGFQTLLFAHEKRFWVLEMRPSVNVTRLKIRPQEAAPGEDVLTHRSVASSVRLLLKQNPPKKSL